LKANVSFYLKNQTKTAMVLIQFLTGKHLIHFSLALMLLPFSPQNTPPAQADNSAAEQTAVQRASVEGAWQLSSQTGKAEAGLAGATAVQIVQDGYFTVAYYDLKGKRFIGTYGGTYQLTNGQITVQHEFNTLDSTKVGQTFTGKQALQNGKWQLTGIRGTGDETETWEKVQADGTSPLAGTWRITGRLDPDGKMSTMQPGPRKTLKMLSDNRFQWIAFNSETAEFFGTGGGTYTAKDGKYTENIEFFSRDSSRVGAQLTFDFKREGNNWHHSGLSSTGKPINEVWQKQSDQK
jgi:hypothetical protein